MALLSRGYAPQGMATLFGFVRLQSNLKATLTYLRRGEQPFSITTKDATEERRRIQAPWTLWVLLALTGLAVVWFACTLAGLTPVVYHLRWTVYGALFWVLVNLGLLAGALSRIRGGPPYACRPAVRQASKDTRATCSTSRSVAR